MRECFVCKKDLSDLKSHWMSLGDFKVCGDCIELAKKHMTLSELEKGLTIDKHKTIDFIEYKRVYDEKH